MVNFIKWAGILVGLLLVFKILNLSIPITLNQVTTNKMSEFAISGTGKVDMVPDTANVSAGITVTNARTAKEAEDRISEINNKIVSALNGLGVKKEDIKTSNFSVNPEYDYRMEVVQDNRIAGYTGNANVTIKVRDAKLASRVVEETTKAGANNVNLSNFTLDEPEKYKEQARDLAIKDAKEQANKLAKNLGIKLGRVVNFVEMGDPGYPMPYYGGTADVRMSAAEAAPPQFEPGSQTVTSTVTLYFETK